jgi:uncharacterized protein (DUF488 family)
LLTIGHSNRPLREFLDMLKAHGVELLADVRTVPRSRHNPQFNRETLPLALGAEGIGYEHMPGLGGLRHPRKDSPNAGWRNLSFRGYADYMQTDEFRRNLEALLALENIRRTAIMCAEAVPWRCHRSLIADALTIRGIPVAHIMNASKSNPHSLTSFVRIEGTELTYPAPNLELFAR